MHEQQTEWRQSLWKSTCSCNFWPVCGKIHQALNLLQTPGTVWASVAFSPFLSNKGKLLLTHQLFLAQGLKCFGDYCPPLGRLSCIKLYQEIIFIINIHLKSNILRVLPLTFARHVVVEFAHIPQIAANSRPLTFLCRALPTRPDSNSVSFFARSSTLKLGRLGFTILKKIGIIKKIKIIMMKRWTWLQLIARNEHHKEWARH